MLYGYILATNQYTWFQYTGGLRTFRDEKEIEEKCEKLNKRRKDFKHKFILLNK